MTRPTSDIARYITASQAASVLGVNERRARNWHQVHGLLVPATKKGLLQYHAAGVIRCACLLQFQRIFGQDSALAVELARAISAEQVDSILRAPDAGHLSLTLRPAGDGPALFRIDVNLVELAEVIERLRAIPW